MQLRTFRGKTMAEALTSVKRELGPDALIVHTRAFRVGGVLGVGAREEVEILAAPVPASAAPPVTRPHKPAIADRARAAYQGAGVPAETRISATPVEAKPLRLRPRADEARAAAPVARLALNSSTGSSSNLNEELGAIKEMVASLLASGSGPRHAAPAATQSTPTAPPDPLADWYLRLLSSSVSRELAERIVADVRRRHPDGRAGEGELREAFRGCVASHIRTCAEPLKLPEDGEPRPRTVAIVGATGVGKTTTIAKLAAQTRLTSGARAGIISCDTERIGAIDQLRTYADIVGAPFRVASCVNEMIAARRAFADTDLLLIDTPGLSPRDARGIGALAELLDAVDVHEVHLALPASGNEAALLGAARAFAPLKPTRLLFTKLDEAVTYGVILSVAAAVRAELSYITTGPRIPEQIERPDANRLADLIAA